MSHRFRQDILECFGCTPEEELIYGFLCRKYLPPYLKSIASLSALAGWSRLLVWT
jgi:hypothetical protein